MKGCTEDWVELDINITINCGGDRLVSVLEDAVITVGAINSLAEHFRNTLTSSTDEPVVAVMHLIAREAERVEVYLRNLCEIAESAASEATEVTGGIIRTAEQQELSFSE